jgi:hypothetical protein
MSIWRDLGYAARSLKRAPGFTVVAVLVLAVGIKANSAMFNLVDAALVRPSRSRNDRLMCSGARARFRTIVSPLNFLDWANSRGHSLSGGHRRRRTHAHRQRRRSRADPQASGTWQFFGPRRSTGYWRHVPADDTANRRMVVVISERLWKSRFGGDPSIVGRTLTSMARHARSPASFRLVSDSSADMWTLFSVRRSWTAPPLHAGRRPVEAGRMTSAQGARR